MVFLKRYSVLKTVIAPTAFSSSATESRNQNECGVFDKQSRGKSKFPLEYSKKHYRTTQYSERGNIGQKHFM
jgi:hypothetical protein